MGTVFLAIPYRTLHIFFGGIARSPSLILRCSTHLRSQKEANTPNKHSNVLYTDLKRGGKKAIESKEIAKIVVDKREND